MSWWIKYILLGEKCLKMSNGFYPNDKLSFKITYTLFYANSDTKGLAIFAIRGKVSVSKHCCST